MSKTTAEDFIKESRSEYIYYETDGTRSPSETKKTCAFAIAFEKSSVYFIKFFRSRPFDPNGVDTNKINSIQANKLELFLRAERKCLDG